MLTLYLQNVDRKWNNYRRYLKPIYQATLKQTGSAEEKDASVVLITSEEMKTLNKTYRNIDRSTDVLSFEDESEEYFGDIFINVSAVESQAMAYGHTLKREFCFLVTHGLLHLLGYDHQTESDKKIMFDLQERILDGVATR